MTAKTLLLMRHAKSDWSQNATADFDRRLNKRGRHAAVHMGIYLRDKNLVPELALVSAAARTLETWERLLAEFPAGDVAVQTRRDLYLAQPQVILAAIASAPENVSRLLVLGHNPGMALTAGLLAAADPDSAGSTALSSIRDKFPTAAIAQFEFPDIPWAAIGPATARLTSFVTPRSLSG